MLLKLGFIILFFCSQIFSIWFFYGFLTRWQKKKTGALLNGENNVIFVWATLCDLASDNQFIPIHRLSAILPMFEWRGIFECVIGVNFRSWFTRIKKASRNDVREVNVWHVNEFGCGLALGKKTDLFHSFSCEFVTSAMSNSSDGIDLFFSLSFQFACVWLLNMKMWKIN